MVSWPCRACPNVWGGDVLRPVWVSVAADIRGNRHSPTRWTLEDFCRRPCPGGDLGGKVNCLLAGGRSGGRRGNLSWRSAMSICSCPSVAIGEFVHRLIYQIGIDEGGIGSYITNFIVGSLTAADNLFCWQSSRPERLNLMKLLILFAYKFATDRPSPRQILLFLHYT